MPRFQPRLAVVLAALGAAPGVSAADDTEAGKQTEASSPKGERTPSRSKGERAPKGAEATQEPSDDPNVVSTEVGEEGVKTYEFGAVEVEGRLRSPQIIYFLRRVRAQFEAGGLGHRSFMRELSDTRRHPAFK